MSHVNVKLNINLLIFEEFYEGRAGYCVKPFLALKARSTLCSCASMSRRAKDEDGEGAARPRGEYGHGPEGTARRRNFPRLV